MDISWQGLEILQPSINAKADTDIIFTGFNVNIGTTVLLALRNNAVHELNDPAFIKKVCDICGLFTG